MLPQRMSGDESFPGTCPFHGCCIEGVHSVHTRCTYTDVVGITVFDCACFCLSLLFHLCIFNIFSYMHTLMCIGMCSTGSLALRKQCSASQLPTLADDDDIWNICAFYIAQLCVNLILITSVEHISIGGGVLNRSILYPLIRQHVYKLLAGYIENSVFQTPESLIELITTPFYGKDAGIVGAVYLGQLAYSNAANTSHTNDDNSNKLHKRSKNYN